MPRGFIHDLPAADHDDIGHDELVKQLVDALEICPTPFVLGLHGEWGAGKTTVLHKLKQALEPSRLGNEVVLFEAWRHEGEARPEVALLHAIRQHFGRKHKLWREGGKLLNVTAYGALRVCDDLMGALSGHGPVVDGLRAEGERFEAARYDTPLESERFRAAFEAAIKALSGERRLFVLVDDLDRCAEGPAVRLLQAMKLYFHVPGCMFVVAADRGAIERAIQHTLFPGDPGNKAYYAVCCAQARDYGDKLFQSVVQIPWALDLGPLIRHHWQGPDEEKQTLCEIQERFRVLPPNPRKAKRFLSELGFRLDAIRTSFPRQEIHWPLLVAIQTLQTFYVDLYRRLEATPAYFVHLARAVDEQNWPVDEELQELRMPAAEVDRPSRYDLPSDWRLFRPARLMQSIQQESPVDDLLLYTHLLRPPPRAPSDEALLS